MKRGVPLLPVALLGLLLAACTADPLNVVVLNARAPGDKCDFLDNTRYVEGGSVDFRPYVVVPATLTTPAVVATTSFFGQIFAWENNLQPVETSVNGQPVDNGTGNDFIADSVVYEYQYTDPSITLGSETENIHAVIVAGGKADDNSVGVGLIQPSASTAILNSTAIDTGAQTLLVSFQIFGKIVAGTSKHTNKVSFPVTVYQSGPLDPVTGARVPLDCPSQGLIINGGACNIPGRDQVISCKKP